MVRSDNELIVKSISEYLSVVNKIIQKSENLGQFIYRGQSNELWPVSSGLVRRLTNAKKNSGYTELSVTRKDIIDYSEDNIREARKRESSHPIIKGMSDLRLLAEMQHFGAATLLIDFSYSSMIALYMAASDLAGKKGVNGKVYCINYNKREVFSEIVDYKDDAPNHSEKNIAQILEDSGEKIHMYRPYHSNTRIVKQESIFIFSSDGVIDRAQIDYEIIIDKEFKSSILKELQAALSLSEETVYPDFIGYLQANSVNRSYKMKKPIEFYQLGNLFRREADSHIAPMEMYQKALENYSKAIQLDKNLAEAFFERGYITLTEFKEFDDAIDSFTAAIKLKPKEAAYWYNRGLAYQEKALETREDIDFKNAISDYKKAISLDKNDIKPLNNLADLYNSIDMYSLALSTFKMGLSIDKHDPDLWFGLGEVYFNLKNYKTALAKFSVAFQLDKDDDSAVCNMGHCLLKLGRLREAEKCFSTGIKINSNNEECCNYLGVVYFKLQNATKAQRYLSQCIQINAKYADAYNNLGFCYLRLGNLKGAMENIQQGIALGCKDFGYKNLAHCLLCSNDKINALDNYVLAVQEFGSFTEFEKEFDMDFKDLKFYQYKISENEYRSVKNEVKNKIRK